MIWWQTALIAVAPALITALALLAQQRESRRHSLELWRVETTQRAVERHAERVREVHSTVLTALSEVALEFSAAARAASLGERLPDGFAATASQHLLRIRELTGAVSLECNEASLAAITEVVRTLDRLLTHVEGERVDDYAAPVETTNVAIDAYRVAARADIAFGHAVPPTKARRWRDTNSANRPS